MVGKGCCSSCGTMSMGMYVVRIELGVLTIIYEHSCGGVYHCNKQTRTVVCSHWDVSRKSKKAVVLSAYDRIIQRLL